MNYILVGKEVVPVDDVIEWAQWRVDNPNACRIGFDSGPLEDGERSVEVSTVFLGVDHRFIGDGLPIVFETMIFGRDGGPEIAARYCTFDEAVAGHEKICELVLGFSSILNAAYLEN